MKPFIDNYAIATATTLQLQLQKKLFMKSNCKSYICTFHTHHADRRSMHHRESFGLMVYLKVVAEPDLQGLVGQFEVVLVEVDLGHQDVGVRVGVLHLQAVVQCPLGRVNVSYSQENIQRM